MKHLFKKSLKKSMHDQETFKRGDIWIAHTENYGKRPYVIVSNNHFNRTSDYVIVCPITSQEKNALDSHVLFKNHFDSHYLQSTILVEQIMTIKKENMFRYYATLDEEEMRKLTMAVAYTIITN